MNQTARAPLLAIFLLILGLGYVFAHNKVVVVLLLGDESGHLPFAVYASGDQSIFASSPTVVRSIEVTAPAIGVVIVNSTVGVTEPSSGEVIDCSITTASTIDHAHIQHWNSGPGSVISQLSGTRGFDIQARHTVTYNLVYRNANAGSSNFKDSSLTAMYFPAQS